MKRNEILKTLLASVTALVAGAGVALAGVDVGAPAPAFSGKDIDGKTHRLADYQGKIVILEAYNLDCPFCAHHFKTGAMQDLQAYARDKGAVWLVVNSVNPRNPSYRSPEAARKEFAAQKMKAAAWIDDSSGEIGKAYGLKTTPHMVVIDPNGLVAYNGAIDDKPDATHDPRQARNYVREALDKLLAGQKVPVPETKPYGCGVKYGN